jgi:hypothetical protein
MVVKIFILTHGSKGKKAEKEGFWHLVENANGGISMGRMLKPV